VRHHPTRPARTLLPVGTTNSSTSERRPGRPRAGQARATADSLLQTAEALIRRDGPGVTLEQVAAEAGVTKPIVYHHVGNRDALGRALAERLVDRITAAVDAATAGATSPRDGLDRFLRAYLTTVWDDRHLFLYVSGGGHDRIDETLRLADRAVAPMTEGFASMRRDQGADDTVAATWAYAVVGMLHFATLAWIRDDGGDVDTLAAHLGELLWSGLAGSSD
jgi:AcrR family transcriptional regulator